MQVPATVAILLLAFGQLRAIDISSSCFSGIIDASTCCIGVPTSQDVLLRNPSDCGTYFQCVHEVPLLRPCPANLHWSVAANRCEWPELAGCVGAVETTHVPTEKPTREPTVNPTTPSGNNECGSIPPTPPTEACIIGETSAEECCKGVPYWKDLLLPNPGNCGSYIQCVHEKPIVRPCPEGLHWSIAANRCEWPNIAKCNGNSGSNSGENGNENGEPGEGELSDGCIRGEISAEECCKEVPYYIDVLLKNPNDCGTYLQCVHQKPMVRPCPAGLHWSVKANRCEWQNIAECT